MRDDGICSNCCAITDGDSTEDGDAATDPDFASEDDRFCRVSGVPDRKIWLTCVVCIADAGVLADHATGTDSDAFHGDNMDSA